MKLLKSIVMILCICCIACRSFAGDLPSVEDILKYTNEYRASKGKPKLVLQQDVSKAAQKHTNRMASGKIPMGHDGFSERVASLRSANGYRSAAENVARGQLSAKAVVDGWRKSPTHNKNMLGDYTVIGIGVAEGKDGQYYFTQLFFK